MTNDVEKKGTPSTQGVAVQTTAPVTAFLAPIKITGKCICVNHKKYCAVAKWVTHVIESPGCILDTDGPVACTPPLISYELEIDWVERGSC